MSFHSLLNSIIDSQSVTKNSLINETGIDRSSFYQILSGKRIPTKDQITSIIRQLDISATDEMALYDAFYLERLGETNYHYLKFTEKCLRVIGSPYIDTNASNNQTPSRSQELQNKLPDNPIDTDQSQATTGTILYHSTDEIICGLTKFLIHASKKENNHLQVSLPFDLSSRIKLFSSIQSLITSGKFQNATISQILHFHFMQQMNASEGITLDGIREFARNHVISESGFYVEANTADIINALEQLKSRLDRNLFVLDTEKIPVSDNWAFLLYTDQYALLVPNKELDFIICVSDPDIIHALTYTFHSVDFEDYVLDNTLVRNEIQKLISENENRVADSTL